MNAKQNNTDSLDDDTRFDRLVDGELSADEYRTLIASLDDEPSGWRRCALAFLENQALSRELGVIRRTQRISESIGEPVVVKQVADGSVARGPFSLSPARKLILAMAASFLVAFALGVYGPGWFKPTSSPPLTGPVAPSPSAPLVQTPRSLSPVGNVRLVVDGPGGAADDAGELPVYEMNDETAQWLQQDQPAIPAHVLQELERRGHRITREREYVPLLLDDGRQVVVPVEGYQITPASRQPY